MRWEPDTYLLYGEERARPFVDLLARVGAAEPGLVYDLGCGAGNLTALLAKRWPAARVVGVDSSEEMLARAADLAAPPRLTFVGADIRQFDPGGADVVVSNAALHWVDEHDELLAAWATALPANAWLAFSVPANFDEPSHQDLREVAEDPLWRTRLAGRLRRRVAPLRHYAKLLAGYGLRVDAWQASYLHVLPADTQQRQPPGHPVLSWMAGTALRPVRAALTEPEWAQFRERLARRLHRSYPLDDAVAWFAFTRLFVVAHRSAEPPAAV